MKLQISFPPSNNHHILWCHCQQQHHDEDFTSREGFRTLGSSPHLAEQILLHKKMTAVIVWQTHLEMEWGLSPFVNLLQYNVLFVHYVVCYIDVQTVMFGLSLIELELI